MENQGAENTMRRRVLRTQLASGWNGVSSMSAPVPTNVGMLQHQLWYSCDTVPSAGSVSVNLRPAKASFFVPLSSLPVAGTPAAQMVFGGLFDVVEFVPSGITGAMTMDAGLLSVGTSYTPSPNRSSVDRGRFAAKTLASGWNGVGAVSMACPEHDGYAQHQIAIAGGTGNVNLYGRPSGSGKFVLISQFGNPDLSAAGAFGFFPGVYDAFMLKPNGSVTGTINAHIVSVGHEMLLRSTAWQIVGSGP